MFDSWRLSVTLKIGQIMAFYVVQGFLFVITVSTHLLELYENEKDLYGVASKSLTDNNYYY